MHMIKGSDWLDALAYIQTCVVQFISVWFPKETLIRCLKPYTTLASMLNLVILDNAYLHKPMVQTKIQSLHLPHLDYSTRFLARIGDYMQHNISNQTQSYQT